MEKNLREVYRLDERILRVLIVNYDRPEQVRSTLAPIEAMGEEQR